MTESMGREKHQNEIVRGGLMWGIQHPVAHNDHNLVRLGSSGKHLRYLCLALWGLARVPGVTMASSHLTSPFHLRLAHMPQEPGRAPGGAESDLVKSPKSWRGTRRADHSVLTLPWTNLL